MTLDSSRLGVSSSACKVSSSASWMRRPISCVVAAAARSLAAETSSGMSLALSRTYSQVCSGFCGLHRQRNESSTRCDAGESLVNRAVKIGASTHSSSCFRDGNLMISQIQSRQNARDEFTQRFRRVRKNRATNRIAFISQFSHQGKNAGKYVVRIFHYPIEYAVPLGASQPLQDSFRKLGFRAPALFCADYSRESAPSDIERTAFITEPRATATRSNRHAMRVATVCRRTRADNHYDAFLITHCRLERDC